MSISQHRMSSSLAVQQLWDTITVLRFQRQTPNVNYITKHMAKVYNISAGKDNVIFVYYMFLK